MRRCSATSSASDCGAARHIMNLIPCPGCGALFAPLDGPTHRYLGASAGCWALSWSLTLAGPPDQELLAQSKVPDREVIVPRSTSTIPVEPLIGDAYAVQHHGEDSPHAIQSVAGHLLNMHGIITGQTTTPRWALGRALRIRGVFHKLEPPPLGSALTIRHLFPGAAMQVTRSDYVWSVYNTWIALHRSTVERWYERYVTPD